MSLLVLIRWWAMPLASAAAAWTDMRSGAHSVAELSLPVRSKLTRPISSALTSRCSTLRFGRHGSVPPTSMSTVFW